MKLQIGEVTKINGELVRYVGDGKFEPVRPIETAPAGELMTKRFDTSDARPMGGARNVP